MDWPGAVRFADPSVEVQARIPGALLYCDLPVSQRRHSRRDRYRAVPIVGSHGPEKAQRNGPGEASSADGSCTGAIGLLSEQCADRNGKTGALAGSHPVAIALTLQNPHF